MDILVYIALYQRVLKFQRIVQILVWLIYNASSMRCQE